jgi:threonine synthase
MGEKPLAARYQCVRGCPGQMTCSVIYRCPECGGLLEVVHDEAALAARDGVAWRALFDRRTQPAAAAPYPPSGVWGKAEWVLPMLRPENVVSLGEGYTPLLPAPRLGESLGAPDLWVKQCGVSHTGSFKDLGMTVLVSVVAQMIADRLNPSAARRLRFTGDTSARWLHTLRLPASPPLSSCRAARSAPPNSSSP